MWKPKTLDRNKPLYLAIADALDQDVSSGALRPGQRLPTQRELADTFEVNLSTVTRAFKECERRGLVSGTVGRGTFVSADVSVSVPLAGTEGLGSAFLEMGLVLPLYDLEQPTFKVVREALLDEGVGRFLEYADPEGLLEHREAGALWVNRFGLNASAEDMVVTAGSQNALACCLMALFKAGDRIAVDALTYPGIKTAAGLLGIRLVPITLDEEGMIPEALEAVCRREPIRGVYLMPEVHNPTTCSLSQGRRERLAALIEQYGLILMEDDAYAYADEAGQAALSTLVPDQGIFFGGMSKVFGAGLRISFLAAPKRFRGLLAKAILSTVWMASPLNAAMVSRVITGGHVEGIIRSKKIEARARTRLAMKMLSECRIHSRPSGFFLWIELPGGWTGREFELTAREAGVRVFCAEKFAVGGGNPPRAARISLTGLKSRAELGQGLNILSGILAGGYRDQESIL